MDMVDIPQRFPLIGDKARQYGYRLYLKNGFRNFKYLKTGFLG